jgi:hypothetical protein
MTFALQLRKKYGKTSVRENPQSENGQTSVKIKILRHTNFCMFMGPLPQHQEGHNYGTVGLENV